MNKIRFIFYSFVLSLILPCMAFASQEGGGGVSRAKVLAMILIVIFVLTTAVMSILSKRMK